MTVQYQHTADDPVETITVTYIFAGHYVAQSDQIDLCGDPDCACRYARRNRHFADQSPMNAICGLLQDYYDGREDAS